MKGPEVRHRFASSIERIRESHQPLLHFFSESAWAGRDPSEPCADFVAGNPHEMAMPEFVDALQKWAVPRHERWFAYTFNQPDARAAAASALRGRLDIPFEADDLFLTDGAFAGLIVAIRTVTDPGDEVIFMSPPWFFYQALILASHAEPVRVRVRAEDDDLDVDAIASAITDRTRAVIVNSPHNPTGRIYPPETLERLATVLDRASREGGRPIYLVSDEAYSRIVFDDRRYVSPATFYPHTFVVYTFGKTLLTPGERVGYVALPPTMPDRGPMRSALVLAQLAIGGHGVPGTVLQYALADLETLSVDVKHLQRKRDLMVEALRSAGYELRVPQGTFYLLPRAPMPDDVAFAERLARDRVYVLPGSVVEVPGTFRISLTANDEMIERALPVFREAAGRP